MRASPGKVEDALPQWVAGTPSVTALTAKPVGGRKAVTVVVPAEMDVHKAGSLPNGETGEGHPNQ